MLNNDKKGLSIFDSFQIDFNLPKWKKKLKKNKEKQGGSDMAHREQIMFANTHRGWRNRETGLMTVIGNGFGVMPSGVFSNVNGNIMYAKHGEKVKYSLWQKVFNRKKIKAKLKEEQEQMLKPNFEIAPKPEEVEIEPEISVQEFFKSVKNTVEELVLIDGRLDSYMKALEHLEKTGQSAVKETMEQDVEICRSETQLYVMGLKRVITEKQVVEFASKSDKKIKLDWVKNFTRSIPSKVVDAKVACDEKDVFDNYVIMHYDPDNKGTADTAEEKERKRDPIMFGVMIGSFKLYYIGDWEDDYCNLTFDKIVEKLGAEAIDANNITANVSIPNEHTENEK